MCAASYCKKETMNGYTVTGKYSLCKKIIILRNFLEKKPQTHFENEFILRASADNKKIVIVHCAP